jgi:hypothetical protein
MVWFALLKMAGTTRPAHIQLCQDSPARDVTGR